ncbi:DUF2752 domain-containing protein [Kribbella deserti]|uniref:DUF2752 domain-containing protein n=1 Tax=Kribbella deserti TaxID=1926257 RepID=A0ABV6QX21_9ACTN
MTAARIEFRPQGPVEPLDGRVASVAWVGVGGLALAAVYQLSDGRFGIPCLLHKLTGLDCPLCGSTRMGAALLRGDLAAAWDYNAVVLLLTPIIGVAVGYQVLAWLLERSRLVRLPRLRPSRRTIDVLIKVGIVGLILFGVLRNF